MASRKIVWQQTRVVVLGEALCCGLMVAVFALLGRLDLSVVLGALAGGAIAAANFCIMALCVDIAADRGQRQDVAGGQSLIHFSYLGRMAGLFVILALCAKSGVFHLIALVVPLVFVRPILTVHALTQKKGDPEHEHER